MPLPRRRRTVVLAVATLALATLGAAVAGILPRGGRADDGAASCAAYADQRSALPGSTTVTVLGPAGGLDPDPVAAFERCTGVTVAYEGVPDVRTTLDSRRRSGTLPDLAVMARPAVTSLVWYSPKYFRANALTVPRTADALRALADVVTAQGIDPWCSGSGEGILSGTCALYAAGSDDADRWSRDLAIGVNGDVYAFVPPGGSLRVTEDLVEVFSTRPGTTAVRALLAADRYATTGPRERSLVQALLTAQEKADEKG